MPLLPVFVFDGPNRAVQKRGKRIGMDPHPLTQGAHAIVDAFGFERRTVRLCFISGCVVLK